ncbi:MAG: ComF family protein [Candidatus Marinimicrobia bacterium]|nr:ComF family protein [Candidatus Neomarinimicrobiota bacterium]MCF7880271.1 ComF family protein [Candidatus Neomarinimicrobiota bacterium]
MSCWDFTEDLQQIIHAMKYRRKPTLGQSLVSIIGAWKLPAWMTSVDVVIPVPLHKTKRRDRGYNQAVSIAKGVATLCSAPIMTDVLVRQKYTASQTTLTRAERQENLAAAFVTTRKSAGQLKGKSVLLVDDVFTTGATLENAAESLQETGAKEVFGFTLASAPI